MRRSVALLVLCLAANTRELAAQLPDWVQQVLAAAELPVSAAQARSEGAPADQVRAAIEAMAAARVRAHDARVIIDAEREAIRENGPVDNFGAFVQQKLAAGLRGRDLAAAIRAEHAARGRGRGQANAPGRGGAKGSPAARGADSAARGRNQPARPSTPDRGIGTKGKAPARPDRPTS